jgi:hypothetical protein
MSCSMIMLPSKASGSVKTGYLRIGWFGIGIGAETVLVIMIETHEPNIDRSILGILDYIKRKFEGKG